VSTISAQPLPAQTAASPGNGGEPQVFVAAPVAPPRWWKLYGSEQLNRLVDVALRASPNIAAAQAALREAQQNLIAQRGVLLPSLSVGVGVTRQEVNGASQGLPQLGSVLYNLYNTSISLAYNPDVFGGVRRAVEGDAAAQEARRNEVEAASQALAANVVTTAVLEASLRAQSDATEQLIASARRQLDLTRQQLEFGSVPRSALATANANLALFEANLPPLQQQIAVARSQLAVYLGETPAEYDNASLDLVALRLPREIPLMLPADLVRRRPDIREAEAQLHQASANIGVATANLLPQVNISGNVGYSSLAFGKLLDGRGFSVGTNLTQPIFQGGTLMARRRAAIAAYEQAMAQYQQTVLLAFKGVADSLRALDNDAQSLAAQHRAQSAATESLELIEQRFRYGSASDLELLTAQQQFQRARIGYVQALASRYTDTAALFLALGGDWGSSTDSCP
jgi:NodT family efflux transporter outer membrane factor (OMF) lipoprotein